MRVRVTAPCRADLAGGTLDIWPLGLLHPGAVTVNTAIPVLVALEVDLEAPSGEVLHFDGDGSLTTLGSSDAGRDLTAAVALAVAPGGGVRVRVVTQAPMGSGLGGSSAYGVALARALLTLENRREDDHSVVALVRDLEARILSVPTGTRTIGPQCSAAPSPCTTSQAASRSKPWRSIPDG